MITADPRVLVGSDSNFEYGSGTVMGSDPVLRIRVGQKMLHPQISSITQGPFMSNSSSMTVYNSRNGKNYPLLTLSNRLLSGHICSSLGLRRPYVEETKTGLYRIHDGRLTQVRSQKYQNDTKTANEDTIVHGMYSVDTLTHRHVYDNYDGYANR